VVAPFSACVGEPMNILDRYIARQVIWFTLLVTVVLITLGGLFSFIEQQSDVGVGTFSMVDALAVTALKMPKQAGQLLPIAALIGALLGLGNLARGSELIVIRAAGVSVVRMAMAVAAAGTLLFAVGVLIAEYVAPPLDAYANEVRTFGKYANFSFAGKAGIWLKDKSRIVSVQEQGADSIYGGVYIFDLETDADGHQRLSAVTRASHASLAAEHDWSLADYESTTLSETGAQATREPMHHFATEINADLLGAAVQDPDVLSVRGLYRFVGHLKANGLESRVWEIAYWSRIARMLSTIVMCMLAVPFVFGPLRSSGAGSRMAIGIGIGIVYVLINRMLENSGDVYGLSPLLVAWGPFGLLAAVTSIAIARTR
jgi:lipopolysaccharide export system permease protein